MANIKKTNSELSKFVGFLHNSDIKELFEDIYLITVNVAGLDYTDDLDIIFPKIKKESYLELFREKNNQYDDKAIVVKFEGEKIGYVPRKHNIILANLMDAGKEIYGVVSESFIDSVYEGYEFKSVSFKIYLKG